MTESAGRFVGLSRAGLAAFAASRADALGVVVAPHMVEEVVDNLAVLQGHARAFLAAAETDGGASDGSEPDGAG